MARPATGSARWNPKAKTWEARVSLGDGKRVPVAVDVPACLVLPSKPPPKCACTSCAQARRVAKIVSDGYRATGAVPEETAEVADEWYERYHGYQIELGQTDAVTKRSRWLKWISPKIGRKPLALVTRNDVEDIRDALDVAIAAWKRDGRAEDRVSGKTAMNAWSALTSSFKAATSSKRRDLRVLDGKPNPCTDVEPPGDKDSRKARRKPFVYPRECATLLACKGIPLEWREIHAIAAYTYLRPGELRVLTWADVDQAAGIIHVSKAWNYSEAVDKAPKTRNGVRRVPIEPALLPLLERMRKGREAGELVVPSLSTVPDNSLAEYFRAHLMAAGVERHELHHATRTHAHSNFRSWRDSGLTWLALTGLGVDKIMRRAGHDTVQTTMGYVKMAEDLGGDLGTPFGALPETLTEPPPGSGGVSVFRSAGSSDSAEIRRRARDSNPWEACTST